MSQFSASFLYEAIDKVTPVLKEIKKAQKEIGVTVAKTQEKIRRDLGKSNTIYVKHEKVVSKTTRKIREEHKKTAKSMESFTKMKSFGSDIMTKVGVPFVAGTTAMIMAGGKFEDSLASLQAITGVSKTQLDKMKVSIMGASSEFGIGSSQIAKGMELIGSKQPELLKNPDMLLNVAKASMTMSKASGIAFEQTSSDLLDVMNTFEKTGSQAMETVNLLASASKYGSAQIPFVTSAMKNAGTASKLAKVSMGELIASIEIISEKTGLASERIGTGLKTAFIRLEKQGMSKFKPSVVGLEKALINLNDANMDTVQLTKLLGEEAITSFPALIKNAKAFGIMNQKIRGTNVATEQAQIRMATFNEKMKKLWVNIQNNLIKAFDTLRPILVKAMEALAWGVKVISNFIANNQTLVKVLFLVTGAVVALGVAITAVGSAGVAFVTIKGTLAMLSPVITALTAKMGVMGVAMKGLGVAGAVVGAGLAGWTIGKMLYEIPAVKKQLDDLMWQIMEWTGQAPDDITLSAEEEQAYANSRKRMMLKRQEARKTNAMKSQAGKSSLDVNINASAKDMNIDSVSSSLSGDLNLKGKNK